MILETLTVMDADSVVGVRSGHTLVAGSAAVAGVSTEVTGLS